MPFGTDYMTAAWVAEQAAARYGGVAFPPLYYGDMRYILQECRPEWRRTYAREMRVPEAHAAAFGLEYVNRRGELVPPPDDGPPAERPIGFGVPECEAFFAELIARILLAIHLYGFRSIILLPGHGPNPKYCAAAEEMYRQNVRRRRAFGEPARTMSWMYLSAARQTEPRYGKHWLHADTLEGAFTMVAAPGTVHPEFLPPDRQTLVPAYLGEPFLNETRGYNPELKESWESFDYFDPRNGMTEEYGRRQAEGFLAVFLGIIRDFMA